MSSDGVSSTVLSYKLVNNLPSSNIFNQNLASFDVVSFNNSSLGGSSCVVDNFSFAFSQNNDFLLMSLNDLIGVSFALSCKVALKLLNSLCIFKPQLI